MAKAKLKPRGPGRLSAEETAKLGDRVLDAAEAVFLDQGFARATIDAIAKAAGATRKTIYARYADKEAIFSAVIARVIDSKIAEPRRQIAPDKTPRDQLLHLARDLVAFVSSPTTAGLNRLVFSEGHQTPEMLPLLNVLYDREIASVSDVLVGLRDQGALPKLPDPRQAAVLFIEMTSSTARMRGMLAGTMPRKQVEAYLEASVDLFMAGCGHRAKA